MFSDFNLINEIKDYWEYRINRNNIEKLNREIINVNKIMMKNIDSLLERDGYLNEIDSLSKSVMSSSRNFEKTAMDIRIKTQKNDIYNILIIISSIIFFIILFKLL